MMMMMMTMTAQLLTHASTRRLVQRNVSVGAGLA
jgi:hypothetical protein